MIEQIKQRMETLGMNANQFSIKSGVPKGTISKILNGHSDPRLSTCEKLIKALDR